MTTPIVFAMDDKLEACVAEAAAKDALLIVHATPGFLASGLDALAGMQAVTKLRIRDADRLDVRPIQRMAQLTELWLDGHAGAYDASGHTSLRRFSCDWNPSMVLPGSSAPLEWMGLDKFAPLDGGLEALRHLRTLRRLSLIRPSIRTLSGIADLAHLEELWLWSRRAELSVAEVWRAPRLRLVVAQSCKELVGIEAWGPNGTLEELRLVSCGSLKSLRGMERMSGLRRILLYKTRIEDQDMTPLAHVAEVDVE